MGTDFGQSGAELLQEQHDEAPEEESMHVARAREEAFAQSHIAEMQRRKVRQRSRARRKRMVRTGERSDANGSGYGVDASTVRSRHALPTDVLERAARAAERSDRDAETKAHADRLRVQEGRFEAAATTKCENGIELVEVSDSRNARGYTRNSGKTAARFLRNALYGVRKRRVNPGAIARKISACNKLKNMR